jgi:phospholipid/cholesterol/gamma-HCH transport system substrate-binding protein
MGSKAIDIRIGNSTAMASGGDTLQGFIQTTIQEEITQQIEPLKNKAASLMESIDSAMMVIRYVFNDKTRQNLETSFASIKNTILNLEHITYNTNELVDGQKARLTNILGNVESISQNLKNNNKKITNIVENFSGLSDTIAKVNIAQTFRELNTSLSKTSELLTKVSKGQGSLGKLLTDDSLYNSLNHSSAQLDLLVEDLRLNPKRYVHFSVFGKNSVKSEAKPTSIK